MAVKLAKNHVLALYDQEPIQRIGLEEVEYELADDTWLITIGFERDWSEPDSVSRVLSAPKRTYKVIHIRDKDGVVTSMRNRNLEGDF